MTDIRLIANSDSGSSVRAKLNLDRTAVFYAQDFGWLPNGTDMSTQALALLAAWYAAGGGTIYFHPGALAYRADSQLLIPNDSSSPQPRQPNLRLSGAGGGANWYANPGFAFSPNAVVLDLRYNGTGAKIESLGLGALVIENLEIKDGGSSNGTPLVHSSNTTLTVRGNTFVGSGAKTAAVTITIASPAVVSWTAHGLQPNSAVKFTNSGGALPTGITASQLYYVSATGLTADTFQISANSGTASIITSGSQSGTQTCLFGGQDAIVLGGIGTTPSGAVDGPFQGYGTVIDDNVFTKLNRGVYGLNWANDIKAINNSFIACTGTVAIESDASCGFSGSQTNTGWSVYGNTIEMDVYTSGIKLVATNYSVLGPNSFYDGSGKTSYRLEATVGHEASWMSNYNTFIKGFEGTDTFVTQYGNTAQLTQSTIIGATSSTTASTGATATISSEIAIGLVVKGQRNTAKQYPGPLVVIDSSNVADQLSIAYDASIPAAYFDAYNLSGGYPTRIYLNPRGGAVGTGAEMRVSKTAAYTVLVTDSSIQFDNTGATGTVIFTLPTDPTVTVHVGGVRYGFAVVAAQTLEVIASAFGVINNGGTVSAAGGNIQSATVGSYVEIEQVDTANGRKWFVKTLTGTWTVT